MPEFLKNDQNITSNGLQCNPQTEQTKDNSTEEKSI